MAAVKKILVPTDFSKFSDSALKQAVEMPKQNRAKIYLFHVVQIVQQCAIDYCLDNVIVEDLEQKSMQASLDVMQKQIRRVAKSSDVEIVPASGRTYVPFASPDFFATFAAAGPFWLFATWDF